LTRLGCKETNYSSAILAVLTCISISYQHCLLANQTSNHMIPITVQRDKKLRRRTTEEERARALEAKVLRGNQEVYPSKNEKEKISD